MLRLTLNFETVTPLFLGDADRTRAALRPPAFKGLLRFWYRAADPTFRINEGKFFGGTGPGEGQSNLLLTTDAPHLSRVRWDDFNDRRFNMGQGRETRNGLIYLGFPLRMKGGAEREAIAPGQNFAISCVVPRQLEDVQRFRRAVVAAFWLLAHFGAVGTRSRRGFGVLSLNSWEADGEWPEIDALPLVAKADSPAAARAELHRGVEAIRTWFGPWEASDPHPHPHLGNDFAHKLVSRAHRDWASVLADMGKAMQAFRSRRAPDYQDVKDHLTRRRPLGRTPERASFGLPLAFRYGSLKGQGTWLVPYPGQGRVSSERHGSLLFLRALKVGTGLHAHYVRMAGSVPGFAPPAVVRGGTRALRPPEHNAMATFFDGLDTEGR